MKYADSWDLVVVYNLPPESLAGLTLKLDADAVAVAVAVAVAETTTRSPSNQASDASSDSFAGSQACSLCQLSFATVLDQRSHIKSDLHNYNLKQKLRGQSLVSEAEFEKLIETLDESLSGSDSGDIEDDDDDDDDDEGRQESTLTALLKKQARLTEKRSGDGDNSNNNEEGDDDETAGRPGKGKPPLIWFGSPLLPEDTYFGIYRAIFTEEELGQPDLVHVIRKKQLEPMAMPKPTKDGTLPPAAYKSPHFFLCMIGGGHFAAMVVSLTPRAAKSGSTTMNREATVLAHKTFHRYTTRRKQGGSQSASDNAKGKAHSVGSSLRRYNETALVEDVRALLHDWRGLLGTSELLFVRATGTTNRRTLFGPYEGQVLQANDARIRGFPFSTRRATQNELMRSFIELTRLKVRELVPPKVGAKDSDKSSATQSKAAVASKPAKPALSEEEETALLHTSQLQALVRRSKLPALLSYLAKNELSPDFDFYPPEQNHHAPRLLHYAAAQNSAPLVLGILTRAGANPLPKNTEGKTAFELAGDRSTRDAFRVARSELGEDKWQWDTARVPSAMTRNEADHRDERERQEADRKEADRRKAEEWRLRAEGPKVPDQKAKRGAGMASTIAKTPQERREEEYRGLTPDMKMRLERERRARAAEERIQRLQGKKE
ncbi:c2h2 finger and ankyrin domain-containing [Trichoderma cornu-damae]|uniref:C2h2 finger and ankyrin domain-containing n=1 Tax=Trichoderma cornu-damae TaxID=654480 RepID=A0A9P8QIZ9_9HYPO|nr:c2h2 finger and ankyrin domain-containing [Trichoderma cornu-damae]